MSEAWIKVQTARAQERPTSDAFITGIFDDFIELHGDRYYGDDGAIMGGIASINDMPVTVIGIVKGKSLEENQHRNYGMVHPEGYRKAHRLMKQAEKFQRPIITFIDTPGAYPGIGAEERGQGSAIAENLMLMADLTVPVIAIVLGEAGSGGALALGVANQVWMMEHAIYSILSPEGFASILYKDASKAPEIVDQMKITAQDLLELGVIDNIIKEPVALQDALPLTLRKLHGMIADTLKTYSRMKPAAIKKERQKKFRSIGEVYRAK